LRLPFFILKKQGDESPHLVDVAQTLRAAKARVRALAEVWPGEYLILRKTPKGLVLLESYHKSPKSKHKKDKVLGTSAD
jgi:hypothetical protein